MSLREIKQPIDKMKQIQYIMPAVPLGVKTFDQMDLNVQSLVRIFSGFQGRKVRPNHHRKGISLGRFQKAGGLQIIQKLDYGIPELNLAAP